MMTWWHSIETLTVASHILNAAAAVLVVVAVIVGIRVSALEKAKARTDELRAERAEAQLATLQERQRARRLTDEQRAALLQALGQEPKGPIRLEVPIGDSEALAFAHELRSALSAAGFQPTDISLVAFENAIAGNRLVVHHKDEPHATELQRALSSIGAQTDGIVSQTRTESLTLIVGHKP